MSKAEEDYMEGRRKMEYAITSFYQLCQVVGHDDELFADDINQAVDNATDGKVKFDDWME
jgi:hypothetical protein